MSPELGDRGHGLRVTLPTVKPLFGGWGGDAMLCSAPSAPGPVSPGGDMSATGGWM